MASYIYHREHVQHSQHIQIDKLSVFKFNDRDLDEIVGRQINETFFVCMCRPN